MNQYIPVFKNTFDRRARLLQFVLRRLLRAHKHDFKSHGRIAAIIGDEISDQIRIQGRYDDINLRAMESLLLPHLECAKRCFLDVGANIGNHSIFFSSYFKRVVAVEPNPLARELLKLNLQINGVHNVDVRTVGLSDRQATAILSVCQDNLGASRLQELAIATSELSGRIIDEVEIELLPGDNILESDIPIGLIKIDVEGWEHQVLIGLARTLERYHPVVVIEQLAGEIDPNTRSSAATDFLAGLGYRPFEFQQIFRSRYKFVNDFLTYLYGDIRYALTPISRLEMRNYSALVFLSDQIAGLIEFCE